MYYETSNISFLFKDIWKITKVEHNAKATMAGDILYQVDATDPEGDDIEYEILSCVCEWMHTTCDDIYYIETGTLTASLIGNSIEYEIVLGNVSFSSCPFHIETGMLPASLIGNTIEYQIASCQPSISGPYYIDPC